VFERKFGTNCALDGLPAFSETVANVVGADIKPLGYFLIAEALLDAQSRRLADRLPQVGDRGHQDFAFGGKRVRRFAL